MTISTAGFLTAQGGDKETRRRFKNHSVSSLDKNKEILFYIIQ